MKKVTMFILPTCPYCKQAEDYLKSLMDKHPEYRAVEIERIDESKRPDISDQYDYSYVPAFYIGRELLHEGVPTPEKVEAVLKAALE